MEWTIVTVISTLVGLYFLIYNPMSKNTKENTKAMTELTVTMQHMAKEMEKTEENNSKSHDRIWAELKVHDGKIVDHEDRLKDVERK